MPHAHERANLPLYVPNGRGRNTQKKRGTKRQLRPVSKEKEKRSKAVEETIGTNRKTEQKKKRLVNPAHGSRKTEASRRDEERKGKGVSQHYQYIPDSKGVKKAKTNRR